LSFTKLEGRMAALFLVAVVVLTLRLLWNVGAFGIEGTDLPSGEIAARAQEDKE